MYWWLSSLVSLSKSLNYMWMYWMDYIWVYWICSGYILLNVYYTSKFNKGEGNENVFCWLKYQEKHVANVIWEIIWEIMKGDCLRDTFFQVKEKGWLIWIDKRTNTVLSLLPWNLVNVTSNINYLKLLYFYILLYTVADRLNQCCIVTFLE